MFSTDCKAAQNAIDPKIRVDAQNTDSNKLGIVKGEMPKTEWDNLLKNDDLETTPYGGFDHSLSTTQTKARTKEGVDALNQSMIKESKARENTTTKYYFHTSVDSKSAITDGKYTTDPVGMARHKSETVPNNKSVFKSDVDAEKATLDAARFADKNDLWNAQNKAKIPVANGDVGYLSDGTPTQTVNVYRKKTRDGFLIHGTPGSDE